MSLEWKHTQVRLKNVLISRHKTHKKNTQLSRFRNWKCCKNKHTLYTLHDSQRERGTCILAIHDTVWSTVTDNQLYLRQMSTPWTSSSWPWARGNCLDTESVRVILNTSEHRHTDTHPTSMRYGDTIQIDRAQPGRCAAAIKPLRSSREQRVLLGSGPSPQTLYGENTHLEMLNPQGLWRRLQLVCPAQWE